MAEALRNTAPDAPLEDRVPLKLECALTLLLNAYREGTFVTTLDALTAYGDTCWHTTVAALREHRLTFEQKPHPHPHRHGGIARFQAYRLCPDSVEAAERLLACYQAMPGR